MKKVNELWLGVFGLLSIFIFIEGLHMVEHQHCRDEVEEQTDTMPSDYQPPGVDEEDDEE